MSTRIERLRYFDGEYLRSFDFEAEQNYHLQMRRRLNMGLHLAGIVEGLDIVSNGDPVAPLCWISPGMAIDAFGREIFVASNKVLDLEDDAFQSNRINPPGNFSVWLRFLRSASTPPSSGYSACNETGLTTRWQELFEVVLLLTGSPEEKTYNDAAAGVVLTGALSENAASDRVAVYLGTVDIAKDQSFSIPVAKRQKPAKDGSITEADGGRAYIGVRAQRITTPVDPGEGFNILNGNTPQSPPTSVEVDGNLFATENLVVGADFTVPAAGITPAASGNAKITGDLYLNGSLYAHQGATWISLDAYLAASISKFIPDVRTGLLPITIGGKLPKGTTGPPAAAVDSTTFTVTSALAKNRAPTITAALAQIEFIATQDAQTLLTSPSTKTQDLIVQVTGNIKPSTVIGATPSQFDVTLSWAIGPTLADADPTKVQVAVKSLSISYVIVFYPDTTS